MHTSRGRSAWALWLTACAALAATAVASQLRLTEVMPSDRGLLPDEDAECSGWIEIENSGPDAADLGRVGLSDDPSRPFKWTFPDLSLPAGRRIIVFTSGKNRRDSSGLPQTAPPGQPLAPELQNGLTLWLDAADSDSLVLADGRVAEWRDR
ncbi:MAG TPA: hypothetical protein PK640_22120, partial [Verrucomicrobiota bacterium]|nr:hypothetical protein [Verrucomicrobiota bacterium]